MVMYLPIPLFGVFLARIGLPQRGIDVRAARVRACGEDRETFVFGIKVAAGASIFTAIFAMTLAMEWTGFPVPFTHLSAGAPGFLVVFVVTAISLGTDDDEDFPSFGRKMVQLLTLQAAVFIHIAVFAVFNALLYAPSTRDHQFLLSQAHKIAKMIPDAMVSRAMKDEYDNALPFMALMHVSAQVFPMVALPSTISHQNYILNALMDFVSTFWSLKMLWLPILKLTQANKKMSVEQTEADAAAHQVATLKDRLRKANDDLKIEQNAGQNQLVRDIESKLAQAEEAQQKEDADVATVRTELEKTRSKHDLGGLASETMLVKAGHLEGETNDDFEARIGVDVDGDGDIAGMDNMDHLTGEQLADAEAKMMAIVTMILQKGTAVLIPLLVIGIEVFLYYGWNGQAAPTLIALTPGQFARSTILKLVSCVLNLASCCFAHYCVKALCVLSCWLAATLWLSFHLKLKFDTWVLYAFAAVLRSILLMWRHMRFPDTSGSS
jgi:hypothetical protein